MNIASRVSAVVICFFLLLSEMTSRAAAQPHKGPPDRHPTVAVLYFDYSGKADELGVLRKGLAQMLISDLAAVDGVRIVERDRLQALLTEMKLSRSTQFDAKTASRIGKLLGARYLVLGNYLDFLGTLRVNADLVEVETGVHTAGTSASGKPEEFLAMEQKLNAALAKAIGSLVEREPSSVAPPRRPRVKPPARLRLGTAVQYAKALDAMDRGDRSAAKTALQAVVKEQPDFALASADLDALVR